MDDFEFMTEYAEIVHKLGKDFVEFEA